jgi:hypothetical protein
MSIYLILAVALGLWLLATVGAVLFGVALEVADQVSTKYQNWSRKWAPLSQKEFGRD